MSIQVHYDPFQIIANGLPSTTQIHYDPFQIDFITPSGAIQHTKTITSNIFLNKILSTSKTFNRIYSSIISIATTSSKLIDKSMELNVSLNNIVTKVTNVFTNIGLGIVFTIQKSISKTKKIILDLTGTISRKSRINKVFGINLSNSMLLGRLKMIVVGIKLSVIKESLRAREIVANIGLYANTTKRAGKELIESIKLNRLLDYSRAIMIVVNLSVSSLFKLYSLGKKKVKTAIKNFSSKTRIRRRQ